MHATQRYSKKREAILQALMNTQEHPSAEWVYLQMRERYPDISLGTVYRNLAQFREDGTVITVGNVDGHERYDGNVAPHSHFVCRDCGAVLDLPAQQVTAPVGNGIGIVDACSVTFFGRCQQCKEEIV